MSRRAKTVAEPEQGTVAALTHDGAGIVRAGKAAFVGGALPGEVIRFRRTRRHRGHDEGQLLEVLEPSTDRVIPRCSHFGVCGGCALQHLSADRQIEVKERELRDALERVAKVTPAAWLPPLRGPQWGYRRRARLGARYVAKKGRVVVGFRERLAPLIAALDHCEVLSAPLDTLIAPLSVLLTGLASREQIPQIEVAIAENITALVLRVLCALPAGDIAALQYFAEQHRLRIYLQTGGPNTIAPLQGGTDLEPLRYSLPEFDVVYDFAPTDFVQINAALNQAMVSRVIGLLELDSQSRVLDLYCGLGNFTLPLARRAGAVLGIEGDAALVARARHNAQMNGLTNAQFVAADLTQPLVTNAPYLAQGFSHVVLDPPRAGALEVMPTIAHLAPRKVAYISCHPGSLARDIAVLVHEFGFSLRAAGVLDMFPHTTHVESLAVLTPPQE
ncbi:MAG TPA: 23S rRNA (uracil(1939)-C(5))-methyltransferase RlmD [Steroidobacteraceae bacterium]|jgi:23S rRNA (uracil1939-C5)-methyltransferase|nr:23S rRNA (uracil(1939)-C(5))-methyltransferase RlmD [Steroidobacteraceae bacterium]